MFGSNFSRVAVVLAGFGALAACKAEDPGVAAKDYPSQMARGECDALMACGCPDNNYEGDLQGCFYDRLEAYTDVNNLAFSAGLAYDPQCPSRQLDALDDLGCDAIAPSLPAGVCVPPCSAWHGTAEAGQPCQILVTNPQAGVAFSTCAQGLACVADFCVDPCSTVEVPPAVGQPCPDMVCEEGAICDATTDVENPVCVDLPGTGDPCFQGVCDPSEAVCIPEANVCGALPGFGEPCEQGACRPEAHCSADDICEPSPALVCGLVVDVDNESGMGDTGDTGDETGSDDGTTDDGSTESDTTGTDTGLEVPCEQFCEAYITQCVQQQGFTEFETNDQCFDACTLWDAEGVACRFVQIPDACEEAGNLGTTC